MNFNEYHPSLGPVAVNTDEGYPAYILRSCATTQQLRDLIEHSHSDAGQLDALSHAFYACYPSFDKDLYPHCNRN